MQNRRMRLAQSLRVAGIVLGCALMTIFVFDDGHKNLSPFGAAAEATETPEVAQQAEPVVHKPSPQDFALPAGFQGRWQQVSLDHGEIRLDQLEKPFPLQKTRHQLGSEYYEYAAFQFEQMAADVASPALAKQLQTLSLQAQILGHAVDQAGGVAYDGLPSETLDHLQVRSHILTYLNQLNPQAMITARYDQHGRLLERNPVQPAAPGKTLKAFLDNTQALLAHPDAARYPETMAQVRKHSDLLKTLSEHLALRWESTQYCSRDCDKTLNIRIYTQQTLPPSAITAKI